MKIPSATTERKARAEYRFVLDSIRRLKKKKQTMSSQMYVLLSRKYIFEGKYKLALKTIKKAYLKDPNEPEMLWIYANCLEENDQDKKAIIIYKQLLNKGTARLLNQYPWLGKKWLDSLLNDCRLSLAMCYYVLLRNKLAARWFEHHLKHRKRGMASYFTKKDISIFYTKSEGCKEIEET